MAMTRRLIRGVRTAFWLGWQVESNWTDPFLFAIYSLVRPLSGVLVLFFMFVVLSGGQRGPMLNFFLVGSVLWPYVVNSLQGIAFTVVEDREEYHMIRYIYMMPAPLGVYLVGRAIAKAVIATVGVALTFGFAVVVLGLPIAPDVIDAPYLAASFFIGFMGMWAMGMMVAALSLNLSQQAWSMPEAVGGAFYLLCGAIFPLSQLPPLLRAVGGVLPMTYWLEAVRRGLLGAGSMGSFPELSRQDVFVRLVITTVGACLAGYLVFRWGERRAKMTGNLDRTSNY
jgi:ABC-2 type transport system permease protein